LGLYAPIGPVFPCWARDGPVQGAIEILITIIPSITVAVIRIEHCLLLIQHAVTVQIPLRESDVVIAGERSYQCRNVSGGGKAIAQLTYIVQAPTP
jgi:hypothetical protein